MLEKILSPTIIAEGKGRRSEAQPDGRGEGLQKEGRCNPPPSSHQILRYKKVEDLKNYQPKYCLNSNWSGGFGRIVEDDGG